MKKGLLVGCAVFLSPLVHADSLEPLYPPVGSQNGEWQVSQKRLSLRPAPYRVDLGSLESSRKRASDATVSPDAQEAFAPVQIGLGREIAELQDEAQLAEVLSWVTTGSGGQVAAISLVSPGAVAVRMGIRVSSLPSSAVLRFYTQESQLPLEIHATQVLQALADNQAAGDQSDEGRTFWSPPMDGEEITLEIELPADVSTDLLQVSLPKLSHLYMDPVTALQKSGAKSIGSAGSCNIDYQCEAARDSSLDLQSRSVAKMSYIEQGDAYVCTGTLLNNTSRDMTPYFLSANHCISNQTVASTLVTYWLYRAQTCRSSQLDSEYSVLRGGARLLYTNEAQDTSFFRLNDPAPAGVAFAGWDTSSTAYNLNQAVVALHNPSGDLQKISKGKVVSYSSCTESGCYSSGQAGASAVRVRWSSGVTEGGSSGSGLFSNGYLIAQLYGGFASCSNKTGEDRYSLLGPAYEAGVHQWLNPTTPPVAGRHTVVEFYNPDLNHYFITADEAEQQFVDTGAVGRWLRTGQSFKAGGSVPACRFYGNTAVNPATGAIYGPNSHFYTVDMAGCNELIRIFNPNTPSWKFESYDFSSTPPDAAGNCPAGTQAVHRLYNNGFARGKASNHRFVTNYSLVGPMVSEGWKYEGVDMCAPL